MRRLFTRIGGTIAEKAVVSSLFALNRKPDPTYLLPGPPWVNNRIHPDAHRSQVALRERLLECSLTFAVPVSFWQEAPIGVRSTDLGKFLEWVGRHPDFELRWQPEQLPEIDWFSAKSLKSSQVFNEVKKGKRAIYIGERNSPNGTRVPVEVWKKTSKGNFTSPGWNGSISEIGPSEANPELLELDRKLVERSFHNIDFEIDAVYLWVDGSDPKWLERKGEHSENSDSHGTSASRFTSRNELYFSVATLLRNAPWINRIWLVTDGQTPELGELADKVTIVDHSEFIPADYLPTFNSHVITSHLHRIKGLAEHFLYLNDDILFGRPLLPTVWFDSVGRPIVRYTRTTLPGFSVEQPDVIHRARQQTVKLALDAGLRVSTRSIQHGPHPMRKSVMSQMWKKFGPALEATSLNRFRTDDDVVPEWLHNFVSYSAGDAVIGGRLTYTYIVLNAKSGLAKIAELALRRPPSVICLNDVSELPAHDRASEQITEYRLKKIAALLLKDH
ncbi:MAG: hypothetical protein RI919_509 [Actinomycetota bacterium]|jgi:hypothetical protein